MDPPESERTTARPAPAQADAPPAAVDEIHLVPLGECAPTLVHALAARLSRHVSAACRVLAPRLSSGSLPLLPERDQLDAHALVQHLASSHTTHGAAVVLGVTARDIGLAVFSFVFGLARTDDGRAAVVSLARLDPAYYGLAADAEVTARRALGEMLHELGHVAGLPHCTAADCVMRFAGTVQKADARGAAFCQPCQARLPHWLRPPRSSTWPP